MSTFEVVLFTLRIRRHDINHSVGLAIFALLLSIWPSLLWVTVTIRQPSFPAFDEGDLYNTTIRESIVGSMPPIPLHTDMKTLKNPPIGELEAVSARKNMHKLQERKLFNKLYRTSITILININTLTKQK